MENKSDKSFKISVLVLLTICTISTAKQQYDIYRLKKKLSNLEYQIDEAKNSLSSDIDDVRRAVILWSN